MDARSVCTLHSLTCLKRALHDPNSFTPRPTSLRGHQHSADEASLTSADDPWGSARMLYLRIFSIILDPTPLCNQGSVQSCKLCMQVTIILQCYAYSVVSQPLISNRFATKVLCDHANSACRSPELWDRPQEFNPLRFPLDRPVPNEVTHDFAYLPFGGGKRKCIGVPLLQVKVAGECHLGTETGIGFAWPCSTADRFANFALTCLAGKKQ